LEQETQGTPPFPQSVLASPERQVVPSQQPGQLPGPQVGGGLSQVPAALQVLLLAVQLTQGTPPLPHAPSLVPPRHWVPEQQPEQLPGPQVGGGLSQVPAAALQVWPLDPQSTQATPPLPQAPSLVPPMHWLPAQQPLQLPGPQVGGVPEQLLVVVSQVPPVEVQSRHPAPPVPQALSAVPPMHWLFWQQPEAQVVGPQAGGGGWVWQVPLAGLQLWPVWEQSTQAAPFRPQWLLTVPPKHWLFWQQPEQVPGPQGCPPTQVLVAGLQVPSDAAQLAHRAPPVPQLTSAAPGRHWSPWQQPVEQVAGLQVLPGKHPPETQLSPGPQTTQGKPAAPHAAGVGGSTQVLFEQQPVQLWGPQPVAPSGPGGA